MRPRREKLTIAISDDREVSALIVAPADPVACYVLAHGAGAGMEHPFMAGVADGLAQRQVATLRYQFPFAENGSRRTDPPPVCHATVRAAAAAAALRFPSLPLVAGGKSFGGRMTSQAQARAALAHVAGLAFLGFPLHPPQKPSTDRARHLSEISIPMLFLQGTRDALADRSLVEATVAQLGPPAATLKFVDGADHVFHVLARSGRTDRAVLDEMLDTLSAWVRTPRAPTAIDPSGA